MIEKPPKVSYKEIYKCLLENPSRELLSLINKINDNYEYWDKVKYRNIPDGISNKKLWMFAKSYRLKNIIVVWSKYNIQLGITNQMQRMCHDLDMNFGGTWESESIIPEKNKKQYLLSSLMEEAISSSQMEGASTTRKIAKEMLRKNLSPRGKSQQMIVNNYHTIQFIIEHKNMPISSELLLEIHKLMTENTLKNYNDAGRFRTNNDVVVADGITNETVHIPPNYEDIPEFINDLCKFFNEDNQNLFIHPIIKGIIIHFMIAYVHPFVDGNGRTARALFYWYMLKQGYWLTEYLSISRVIASSKKNYEKSFLYSESDDNDIGYFVSYNLNIINKAFVNLQKYIKRKIAEKNFAFKFLSIGNINERQAQIIKAYYDDRTLISTVKDFQIKFLVSPTTAKSDIRGLVDLKILKEISFNKVKKGYIIGEEFENIVRQNIIFP